MRLRGTSITPWGYVDSPSGSMLGTVPGPPGPSGPSQFISVKDPTYGAVGDNTTDDTTAIQNAINAAAAVGGTVYFPAATYKITSALTLGSSKVTLQGAGFGSSVIHQATAGTHGFSATDKREFVFRDLKITGEGTGNGDGIHLAATGTYAVFDCEFTNVFISGFGRHGIYTDDLCASTFRHVRVEGCGGDGFHIGDNGTGQGGTSLTFSSCYANTCSGSGYYLSKVSYSSLDACATDACNYGYFLTACTGIALNACGVEATSGANAHGFAISVGSVNCTLTACYAYNIAGIGFYIYPNGSNCSRIMLAQCRVLGSTTPTYSLQVDNYCQVVAIGFNPHAAAEINVGNNCNFIAHNNTAQTNLMFTVAGAVSDGSFAFTPPNGTMAVDTTNHRLYIRDGGTWRYSALT